MGLFLAASTLFHLKYHTGFSWPALSKWRPPQGEGAQLQEQPPHSRAWRHGEEPHTVMSSLGGRSSIFED